MSRIISYSFCLMVAGLVFFAFSPRDGGEANAGQLNLGRVQINDLVAVGEKLVAVGERGTIIVSDNKGESWEIVHRDNKVAATLTDITAITDELLLAVGHDSVILRSEDAGLSWTLVNSDSELGEPLLGTWSEDGKNVFLFGSFGKFLFSEDAGLTFEEQELPIYGEHLNAMAGNARDVRIMVGEMGLVLRSQDAGANWEKLDTFYNGSLFGIANLNGARWVAYGMRGHVFFSGDDGNSWTQVNINSELPLYGHVVSESGKEIMIAGTAGILVTLNDQGELINTGYARGLGTLTSVVVLPSGDVYVAGQRGLRQGSHNLVAAWNK